MIFLFTKKFPYSHQETYLFDELPFLIRKFKDVVIVPYDEFEYEPTQNRLKKMEGVSVFEINNELQKLNLKQKITQKIFTATIWAGSFLSDSNKFDYFKEFKRAIGELMHAYQQAYSLNKIFPQLNQEKHIVYNYWLHKGVLISGFLRKLSYQDHLIVSRAHSYDLYHSYWKIMYKATFLQPLFFENWKHKQCNFIFPISSHGHNYLLNTFPKLNQKLKISRLGVYPNEVKVISNDSNFLLVSCSSITENKRLHKILDILFYLPENFKWVHLGGGSKIDMEKLQTYVTEKNLNERCKINGALTRTEVLNFFKQQKVDLFLNTSLVEGIPVALMEAASFGIPMLATKTVGNPEIVNESNGILVDINFDPKTVAEEINELFSNPDLIQEKRISALKTFESLYNADKNYTEFVNFLNQP